MLVARLDDSCGAGGPQGGVQRSQLRRGEPASRAGDSDEGVARAAERAGKGCVPHAWQEHLDRLDRLQRASSLGAAEEVGAPQFGAACVLARQGREGGRTRAQHGGLRPVDAQGEPEEGEELGLREGRRQRVDQRRGRGGVRGGVRGAHLLGAPCPRVGRLRPGGRRRGRLLQHLVEVCARLVEHRREAHQVAGPLGPYAPEMHRQLRVELLQRLQAAAEEELVQRPLGAPAPRRPPQRRRDAEVDPKVGLQHRRGVDRRGGEGKARPRRGGQRHAARVDHRQQVVQAHHARAAKVLGRLLALKAEVLPALCRGRKGVRVRGAKGGRPQRAQEVFVRGGMEARARLFAHP
mmetsp:Transcript_37330/g.120591  ORF Transcript_37330/g.120591 Transcript_37330/m.120591 type:complete len:350 (+) Transcript_37330:211-1260(+)